MWFSFIDTVWIDLVLKLSTPYIYRCDFPFIDIVSVRFPSIDIVSIWLAKPYISVWFPSIDIVSIWLAIPCISILIFVYRYRIDLICDIVSTWFSCVDIVSIWFFIINAVSIWLTIPYISIWFSLPISYRRDFAFIDIRIDLILYRYRTDFIFHLSISHRFYFPRIDIALIWSSFIDVFVSYRTLQAYRAVSRSPERVRSSTANTSGREPNRERRPRWLGLGGTRSDTPDKLDMEVDKDRSRKRLRMSLRKCGSCLLYTSPSPRD